MKKKYIYIPYLIQHYFLLVQKLLTESYTKKSYTLVANWKRWSLNSWYHKNRESLSYSHWIIVTLQVLSRYSIRDCDYHTLTVCFPRFFGAKLKSNGYDFMPFSNSRKQGDSKARTGTCAGGPPALTSMCVNMVSRCQLGCQKDNLQYILPPCGFKLWKLYLYLPVAHGKIKNRCCTKLNF